MNELYIGLMSGTSADGIDAALVDFNQPQPKLIAHHYIEYSSSLRKDILELCQPGPDEINRLGTLDVLLGKEFAAAAKILLEKNKLVPEQIRAIGSHGQTIRHHPQRQFTLQVGDPNIIAAETSITTVADFRRRDMAYGGQGAPLVPAFHQFIFADKNKNRAIINIGGIANVTLLSECVIGFDSGPGNTLLDAWTEKHLQQPYDKNGAWAAQGTVNQPLLINLLKDPFFKRNPPKSTGPDYFNLSWLEKFLSHQITPVDVQATLVEFTARSIVETIKKYLSTGEMFVCGGGIHNHLLLNRLQDLAQPLTVNSTITLGIDPDWVEAIAFAWLAKQTLEKKTGNLMTVTGARQATILGAVYY